MTTAVFIQRYQDEACIRLEKMYKRPLTTAERTAVCDKVMTSYKDRSAMIFNPTTGQQADTSLLKLASWLTDRKPYAPIVTGHGTLFRPHMEMKSVVYALVDYILSNRNVAKNEMFDLMRSGLGPEDPAVKAKDQEQKIFKLLANSWYGASGEAGFHFFDEDLGPATTYQGQLIIASTLMGFESFMSGNMWLKTPDEMLRHLISCFDQTDDMATVDEEWGYDENVMAVFTEENAVETLVSNSAPGWDSRAYATELVSGMSADRLASVILRGNPYLFMSFPRAFEMLNTAIWNGDFQEADSKAIGKHHPEGKVALDALWEGMRKWVAVHWMHSDMPRRVTEMKRRTVIMTDTDSTFLNLHPWMKWLDEMVENFADCEEMKRLTGLNSIVYILRLMNDFQMAMLTKNLGIPEEERGLINFKSEFVIKRMVLTDGKKNYAA